VPTEKKFAQVAELKELLDGAELAISTAYQGIRVSDQVDLRARLTDAGAQMRVVKNTLLRIAAREAGVERFADLAEGPTALVVAKEDPVGAAKALVEWLRTRPTSPVQIRSAVIAGQLVDGAYVRDLATVPPREELLARIAGGLVGQVVQLMGLVQATTREFAGLIEARASQLEGGESAS
jgi:large subunit ribosomal protein L10